jgi:Leucine-rich repeat (LRR) protein
MLDQKENTSQQYSLTRFLASKQERPSSAAGNFLPQEAIVTKKYATTASSVSQPSSSRSSTADDDQSNEITAEYLKSLTGFDELHLVSEAELQVDNRTQSVHLLSGFIPNVVHLRLSRSNVNSIREFGTNFTSLRVLWLSASNLNSLSGIHQLGEHLRELFLAFNHIKDVSPLCFGGLKHLEVLDLEGNMITDGKPAIQELISMKNLPCLKSLNLAGNPFVGTDSPGIDDEEESEADNFSQFQFYHKLFLDRLKRSKTSL